MKNILKTISLLIIACLIPFSMVTGQEKKSQKKIKIVVEDNSGTKIIIDTLVNDISNKDSINLKDGNIIYINHPDDDIIMKPHEKPEKIYLTVSSDGQDNKKEMKEFTIVYSDSADAISEGCHNKIYFYSDRNDGKNEGNVKCRIKTKSSKDDGDKDEIFYINGGKRSGKDQDNTFDVYVDKDEKESTAEKTRYVIAKDGIVVTVEGSDEAKTKELIKEIEKKLGVKK